MAASTAPDVSFIIAAYNAEATLEAAVRSALRQRDVTVEVIVIDDHSTDATLAVAHALAAQAAIDPAVDKHGANVRVVSTPHNAGPSVARNLGLELARGAWIAILDADDEVTETRLTQLCAFAERGGYDLVCDNQYVVTAMAEIDPTRLAFAFAAGPIDVQRLLDLTKSGAHSLGIGYAKPVIRRSALLAAGKRYNATFKIGEDWLLLFECVAAGLRMGYSEVPGYLYRRSTTSLTLGSGNTFAQVARLYAYCARHHAGDLAGVKQRLRWLSAGYRYKASVYTLRWLVGRAKAAVRKLR